MFTGIVTDIGRVESVAGTEARDLWIETGWAVDGVPIGASVCHDGVCLTVVETAAGRHRVQASAETLARTTLGRWQVGTRVNLERSLRLGDELGGHLVFGHVDGLGRILEITPVGDSHKVVIGLPETLAPLVAVKGSIAVDGVSLTVNEAGADRFAVMIIPHSWAHTTLCDRAPGDPVNLEADMLARYVSRQIGFLRAGAA
jgi:riboflavin synthase